jgi:putative CocE/NonD family hydrolase
MTIVSRAISRIARLPRAQTRDVIVEKDIQIPMPDGVVLLADRWYPNIAGGDRAPILLYRTPYGRDVMVRIWAERGYQVVIVRCRGTFGSGGEWRPFFNEEADGHAVLAWLAEQPWFSGSVALVGGSYTGLTQWTVATDPPPFLKATSLGVTTANFRELFYPGGSFTLESAVTWTYGLEHQETKPTAKRLLAMRRGRKIHPRAVGAVPLADVDEALVGHRIDALQEWLVHDDPADPYWAPMEFRRDVSRVPPSILTAGWYDVFIRPQVTDFLALKAAGRDATLTIGPWTHGTVGGTATVIRNALEMADVHLKGKAPSRQSDVRVYVMGARRWVDLPTWPPETETTRMHLQPDGGLAPAVPPASAPDRYRYDPNDPTPVAGGTSLYGKHAGVQEQSAVEARPDVLVYSSDVLTEDVTVVGDVVADLYVRSSLDHTDFFVRLCDVSPKGRSTNLCDGILRLRPGDSDVQADGTLRLRIPLNPTANSFRKGHRIRVQVSSGAHPLYARNTGSGEPLGKATTFVVADQEVFHDPEHPSAIELPVVPTVRPAGRLHRFRTWPS